VTKRLAGFAVLLWMGCGIPVNGTVIGEEVPSGTSERPTVPSGALTCGTGTHEEGGQCAPNITSCGPGSVLEAGVCVLPRTEVIFRDFIANTTLTPAGHFLVYSTSYGLEHHLKQVWTDLSLTDAKAWTTGSDVMIGTGHALHFAPETLESSSYGSGSPVTWSVNLTNTTGADGKCLPGIKPSGKTDTVQLAFFAWNQGTATPVLCAKAGSVRITYGGTGDSVSLSALFGDGSSFEKEFYVPRSN
jgi:hypothetical protein